jgi:dUTP pyrophosphatase
MTTKIKFRLLKETSQMPHFGGEDEKNAGIDFCAAEEVMISPKSSEVVGLDVAWEVDKYIGNLHKYVMIIQSRSGLAFKHQIEASNAGVIDEDYRGEIKVRLYNNSYEPFFVKPGDRICQGIVSELPDIMIVEAEELSETKRGDKGFGSSGIK